MKVNPGSVVIKKLDNLPQKIVPVKNQNVKQRIDNTASMLDACGFAKEIFMLWLVYPTQSRYNPLAMEAGRTAANPLKEGEAMSETLTLFLVVLTAMIFVVDLIKLVVELIKAINKKK